MTFAREAAYCTDHALEWTKFRGWSPFDRELVLEVKRRRDAACSGCGSVTADWFDENGRVISEDEDVWLSAVITCPGCQIKDEWSEKAREGKSASGKWFSFRRRNVFDEEPLRPE